MKDLLSASLMASMVAVQPQQHMVSEPHSASPVMFGSCGASCYSKCDGGCQGTCTFSCQRHAR